MKMNFSVSVDEQQMFVELYNRVNLNRLQNGERIISMSRFFMEIVSYYNEKIK